SRPNFGVAWVGPERTGAFRLLGGESRAPLRIASKAYERVPDGCAVRLTVESLAVAFCVVKTNVIGCRHALDVDRTIVAPVEVDVMAMRSRCVRVDPAAQIPFVGKPMRCQEVSVD